jgi:hypothetical protein
MASVVPFNGFSADGLLFSDMRKNKLGGKAVYINSMSGSKLLVQLPPMRAPFGLSEFTDATTGKVTYSLDLSMDDPDVQKVFTDIDERVVSYVAENSQAFLGKPYKIEVIREALYKPLVRASKGDYAPTLKLKVLTGRDGEFVPEAYDHQRNTVSVDTIDKGSTVHTIIDINQIWFIDNKFGVSIRLQQVMKTAPTNLKGFAFHVEHEEIDVPVDEE